MTNEVRVITMQQFSMLQDNYPAGDPETAFAEIQTMDNAQRERATAELAQAYADGFALDNVAVGGNDRVLLTTWTLRKRDSSDVTNTALDNWAYQHVEAPDGKMHTVWYPKRHDLTDLDMIRARQERADLDLRTLK